MKFEGCIEAKEISLCPMELGGGANPHAHVLVRKNLQPGPSAQPEKTTMTEAEKAAAAAAQNAAIAKAAREISNKIAAMNDVTKAHYLALDDAAQEAFLAKSADEMKAEAEAAKAAADKAAAEAEAAKTGKTVEVVALEKTVASQAEMIKQLQEGQADAALEKRAATEFSGFPGGTAAAVKQLKDLQKLPEESRKSFEDLMKAQCVAAQGLTKAFGAAHEADISKVAAAQSRIDKATDDYIAGLPADKKVSKAVALEKVSEMREYAEDIALLQQAG